MDPAMMNPMLDPFLQLRDIRGLDTLPWWYIAPGWLLLALAAIVLLAGTAYWLSRRTPKIHWPQQAFQELGTLRKHLKKNPGKQLLADFSELLRRIAMARFSRGECAGLHGEAWLTWLQQHDPRGFRWQDEGRILLDLAYAPPDTKIDAATMFKLLDAAQHWIKAPKKS